MSKRKAYRPRAARVDALTLAIQGQAKLTHADQSAMAAPAKLAIEQIAKGQGTQADWQAVFDVINLLDRFVTMPTVMKNGADYLNTIQGVIVKILDRQKSSGTKALYPAELDELRGLLDLWVEILSVVTHREYFQAEERARQKLMTVLRSKPSADLRVVEVA